MSWAREMPKPRDEHVCDRPRRPSYEDEVKVGNVWICDRCNRVWVVSDAERTKGERYSYNTWSIKWNEITGVQALWWRLKHWWG